MKKATDIKKFDSVKTFRSIKNQISAEIKGMDIDQLNKYLEKGKKEIEKRRQKV